MRKTQAANNVAVLPAFTDSEAPGYHADRDGLTPGTTISADTINMHEVELCNAVTGSGQSLDQTAADRSQLSKAIRAVADGSDVSISGSVMNTRALVASKSSFAGSNDCAVALASDNASASGAQSAVVASGRSTASKNAISSTSTNAAIVACDDGTISHGNQALVAACDTADIGGGVSNSAIIASSGGSSMATSGTDNAIVASEDAYVAGASHCFVAAQGGGNTGTISSGADSSALIAANSPSGTGTSYIDGASSSLVTASEGSYISGGGTSASASETSAVVASQGSALEGTSRSLIAASFNSSIKENLAQAAIIGCVESTMPKTSMTATVGAVMLASSYCDGGQNQGTADPPNFSVFGGYHASSLSPNTWRVESNGGYMRSLNAHATGGLDYAEMRPNGDGAAHPPARLLARRGGRAVKLAKAGDPIHSIVSVNPTVLGGDDGLGWQGRYLRDEWGALVIETVEMVRWRAYDGPAAGAPPAPGQAEGFGKVLGKVAQARIRWAAYDGPEALATGDSRVPGAERYVDTSEGLEIQCIRWPAGDSLLAADGPDYPGDAKPYTVMVPAEPTPWLRWAAYDGALVNAPCTPPEDAERYQVRQPALNPDYDPRRPQVPRSERPAEYTKCGLLGELRLQVDETVKVDDEIVPLKDGVGTAGVYCGRGKHVECSAIAEPFDAEKGYAVAIVEIY